MVLEVTRLQLYIETYTRKDKLKDRHPIKKESSEYKRKQQRCPITKGTIMNKKNNSRNYDVRKKDNSRQVRYNQEDQKEQHQRTRGGPSIEEERWINIGRRWNCIHERKSIYSKQQKDQGENSEGKP